MGERDWLRTLENVDQAIDGCLSALERYEAKFAELLQAEGVGLARDRPESSQIVGPLSLAEIAKHSDEVEQLFAEQQALWGRWRESLAAWQRSVGQTPGPPPSLR